MAVDSLPVNSASRAVAIIEFLAARPAQTYSLSEIARRVGLNKSTAHTLIHTLHSAGWLFCSPRDMRYGLGPRLTMIGEAAGQCVPELVVARPIMNELASELQAECVLTTLVKDEIVLLGSTGPVRLGDPTLHLGSRMPCAPPMGTVFVAWLSESDRAERRRQGFDRGYEAMAAELAAIRRRGYVATLRSTDEHRLSRILRDIPDSYFNRVELRNALKERLAAMQAIDYLASYDRGAPPQQIESVQAPVFQEGSSRFALTASHLGGPMTRNELANVGRRVRAAADDISDSIAELAQGARSAI